MASLGGLTLAFSGCGRDMRIQRERVMLTVATPEGDITGSTVYEQSIYFSTGIDTSGSTVAGLRGEALVVDLGARGLLFMLLRADPDRKDSRAPGYGGLASPNLERQAEREGADDPSQHKRILLFWDLLERLKPSGEMPLKYIGLLVRFRDPTDPRTVEHVDPFDLAASFGRGVALTKAAVAITDDPVTTGIEKRLPWLLTPNDTIGINRLPGLIPERDVPFKNKLVYDDFWRSMQ